MDLSSLQDITRRSQVRAVNGINVPAMVVFAHTLRYFRDHALRELSDAVGCRLGINSSFAI